jgi:hypothetical protein
MPSDRPDVVCLKVGVGLVAMVTEMPRETAYGSRAARSVGHGTVRVSLHEPLKASRLEGASVVAEGERFPQTDDLVASRVGKSHAREFTRVDALERRILAAEFVTACERVHQDRRYRRSREDEPVWDVAAADRDVPRQPEAIAGNNDPPATAELLEDPGGSLLGIVGSPAREPQACSKAGRKVGEAEAPLTRLDECEGEA